MAEGDGRWAPGTLRSLRLGTIVRLNPSMAPSLLVRLDRNATSILCFVVIVVRADGPKVLLAVKNIAGDHRSLARRPSTTSLKRGLQRPRVPIVTFDLGTGDGDCCRLDGVPMAEVPRAPSIVNLLARASRRLHDE